MRLKSSIFVSALMRIENAKGSFSTVQSKGAEDAGAIFIVQLLPNGKANLFGPAPQAMFEIEDSGERWFELLAKDLSQQELEPRLQSQLKFDPDCWIIEIESGGSLDNIQIIPE